MHAACSQTTVSACWVPLTKFGRSNRLIHSFVKMSCANLPDRLRCALVWQISCAARLFGKSVARQAVSADWLRGTQCLFGRSAAQQACWADWLPWNNDKPRVRSCLLIHTRSGGAGQAVESNAIAHHHRPPCNRATKGKPCLLKMLLVCTRPWNSGRQGAF